jgi:hypothetical protein
MHYQFLGVEILVAKMPFFCTVVVYSSPGLLGENSVPDLYSNLAFLQLRIVFYMLITLSLGRSCSQYEVDCITGSQQFNGKRLGASSSARKCRSSQLRNQKEDLEKVPVGLSIYLFFMDQNLGLWCQ